MRHIRNVKYGTRNTRQGGFSLIEVMLSVFLLSAGMFAAISLIGGALRESLDSRNQLIASLLAQEGVELVRNIRDNNWASGAPDSFSNMPTATADNCVINYNSAALLNGNCARTITQETLSYNGGFYNTGAAAPTKFKRKIVIVYDTGAFSTANTATLTSMVIWKDDFPLTGIAGCTTGAGCSYAEATLTRWKE